MTTPDTSDTGTSGEVEAGSGFGENAGSGLAGEAARYRRQLRAAEAERDSLAEQVTGMRTREVERLASARLSIPTDLWTVGAVALDGLLDESGHADEARVGQALDELLSARPGLAVVVRSRPAPDPGQGQSGQVGGGLSWSQVLHR